MTGGWRCAAVMRGGGVTLATCHIAQIIAPIMAIATPLCITASATSGSQVGHYAAV